MEARPSSEPGIYTVIGAVAQIWLVYIQVHVQGSELSLTSASR